jgi:signal transduction histidine kinase
MEGQGTLTLRTTLAAGADEADAEGPRRARVEIRVRDTGPGISEAVRENLFIPFFTTKDRGTGLGLPICQRIVRSHGGTLEVHSRPGQGAEFVVRLPARPAQATEPTAEPEAAAGGATVVPFRRRG